MGARLLAVSASEDRWETSIEELMRLLSECLAVVAPVLRKAHIKSEPPNSYDDWDRVAEALYRSLLVDALENASLDVMANDLPKYGFEIGDYSGLSFVGLLPNSAGESVLAFKEFRSKTGPFDTARFAVVDEAGRSSGDTERRVAECRFRLLLQQNDGSRRTIDQISVLL
jgi:hypothetical protein